MTASPEMKGSTVASTEGFVGTREPIRSIRRAADVPLDGTWDFQLLPNPLADRSDDWEEAQVPSLWTMTSPDDRPFYTNVPMPFDEVPPAVPSRNPTGIYRRTAELELRPDTRVLLHVGAAEGELTVVVNGRSFEPSTDSHLEAEFDITPVCEAGENIIELQVAKWSTESYLEDQDQWWHSGIARSVWISYVPEIRIADVVTVAGWDHDGKTGSLTLDVQTTGLAERTEPGYRASVEVVGARHDVDIAARVAAPTLPRPSKERDTRPEQMLPDDFMDLLSIRAADAPIPPEFRAIPDLGAMAMPSYGVAGTASLELTELDVAPWSPEGPVLHEVVVTLVGPDDVEVDKVSLRVGFRSVTIVGPDLLVNGQRVLIQGVNRHDIDEQTGRVITRERMLRELSLLKRFNVNAIRTAHYPNDPQFLDLCDEIGFLVVDEADVEAHGFASSLPQDPRYLLPIMERVSRMVLRDRNHPCVIAWSLGNESGYSAVHDAAAAWVRATDPTRPVHYEGAISSDWHGGRAATDIVAPMYPSFAALEGYARDPRTDRPLILCEYAYSQGNATGGLSEYWRLFESLPNLQGGFIWEFTDHALDMQGDGTLRYGGEFDDAGHNGATMLNGIAFSNAAPKPAMYEMRGIFSPVRVISDGEAALGGTIDVRSRRFFSDVSDLEFTLHVETRSGATAHTSVPVSLEAGDTATVQIPAPLVDVLGADDALALSLSVTTAADSLWAPAGTEIAVEQVAVQRRPVPLPESAGVPELDDAGGVVHPMLVTAPGLNLWRALTDNDGSFALDKRFVRSGFFELTQRSVDVTEGPEYSDVVIRYATAWDTEVVHRRRISVVEGGFRFDEDVRLPEGTKDGLRVGVSFELVEGFDSASWIGLGPWENYPDRNDFALLGRWESSIDDLATPYVIPQENGTRGGVDHVTVRGPRGQVDARSLEPLHASVSRVDIDALEAAAHWWELPESTRTIVNLDIAHRGVGTALLGPDTRPEFRLTGDHYSWSWVLTFTPDH